MIGLRVLWMLLIAVFAGIAASWLASNEGSLRVRWLGWQVETSIAAVLMLLALLFVIFIVARTIFRLFIK